MGLGITYYLSDDSILLLLCLFMQLYQLLFVYILNYNIILITRLYIVYSVTILLT